MPDNVAYFMRTYLVLYLVNIMNVGYNGVGRWQREAQLLGRDPRLPSIKTLISLSLFALQASLATGTVHFQIELRSWLCARLISKFE